MAKLAGNHNPLSFKGVHDLADRIGARIEKARDFRGERLAEESQQIEDLRPADAAEQPTFLTTIHGGFVPRCFDFCIKQNFLS